MQILHAEFDKKKFFSHLFSRKNYFNTIRIEITSERQNVYVWLNFFGCLYFRSTDQLTAELAKLCGICDIAVIFIYFPFWPFSQNNVEIVQHRTLQERCQAAEMLKKSSGCSTPILVDTMDNEATQAYGAYPERLFIVQDRKIVYEGGTGPHNYKLGEVKKWLEVYKASR